MSAWEVAALVLSSWLVIVTLICGFCRAAAPSNEIERQADDEAQVAFLRRLQ